MNYMHVLLSKQEWYFIIQYVFIQFIVKKRVPVYECVFSYGHLDTCCIVCTPLHGENNSINLIQVLSHLRKVVSDTGSNTKGWLSTHKLIRISL